MADIFWGEIEETVENICGVIDNDKHAYFITGPEDDPVVREYSVHSIYDDKAPDTVKFLQLIAIITAKFLERQGRKFALDNIGTIAKKVKQQGILESC